MKTQVLPESAENFRRRETGQAWRSRLKVSNRVVCTLSGILVAVRLTFGSFLDWRLTGCLFVNPSFCSPGVGDWWRVVWPAILFALRQSSDLGNLKRDPGILRIQQHPVAPPFRTSIDKRPAAVDANVNDVVPENYLQGEGAIQSIDTIYPLIVQPGDPVIG